MKYVNNTYANFAEVDYANFSDPNDCSMQGLTVSKIENLTLDSQAKCGAMLLKVERKPKVLLTFLHKKVLLKFVSSYLGLSALWRQSPSEAFDTEDHPLFLASINISGYV